MKNTTNQNTEDYYIVGERNKSQCLAYHLSYEHVAVGTNEGTITVRKNPKELDKRLINPDITLDASERQIGGLGIFIVKQSMDEISYEYKNNQNILTIKKNL